MWKMAKAGNAAVILRLDDRYFGPLERKPQIDDNSVLEALSDDHDVPDGIGQGEAPGAS
jgi:hypothetical protein